MPGVNYYAIIGDLLRRQETTFHINTVPHKNVETFSPAPYMQYMARILYGFPIDFCVFFLVALTLTAYLFAKIWFDFCFTALRHILGHFGHGQLT